jgi:glycosyltransferase involved in cell wall biosynthesis
VQKWQADDDLPTFRLAVFSDAPLVGGAEASIATCLSELSPRIDIVVMGVERGVVDWIVEQRPGATPYVVPAVRGKWNLRSIVAQWRAIREVRPDIFQPNLISPSACRYAIVGALLTRGVRVVAFEHLAVRTDAWTQRRLKQLSAPFFTAHVAVGEKAAREIELDARRPAGTIRSIHNGVRDRRLTQMPRPFAGPAVGSIGRLDSQKGYDVLLQSLADLPDVGAVIVGDGPERLRLEILAAELGVAERVEFLGRRADARDFLTAFDVFVLPSRFEGFPLVLLEAMLARLPVVATDVGSVTEAVRDGVTGLVVQPDDPRALAQAIRTLLDDPEKRRTLGEAGRRVALEFSPARMARDFETLYREVLADRT